MSIEQVWHSIASRSKTELLGISAKYVREKHWSDAYAQPGYVGKDYRQGGLIFIGQNPAGGGDEYNIVHNAIKNFATSQYTFDTLNSILAEDMKKWKIYKTSVNWVLETSGLEFSQTAYFNMFKWRTTEINQSLVWKELYAKCWPDTLDQIEMLNPSMIVLLGIGTSNEFHRHYRGTIPSVAIKRMIGDTKLISQLPSVEATLKQFGISQLREKRD
jgi:hypothetical protein